MRRPGRLLRDRKGISAVEFALIAPVMFLMIVGLTQVGRLFFAEADLNSALTAGARQATIYPMPADNVILDTVEHQLTGLNPQLLVNEIIHYVDANGTHYAVLRVAYAVQLDFLFFDWGPITLESRRTVYTNDPAATGQTASSTSSASSTGGTTTSAGGATTTSAGGTTTTSAGGTTTTSAGGTTTTSAGGTTTTSAGGTTTTSAGGTTTTSAGGTTTTSAGGTTTTSAGGTTTTSAGGTTTTSAGGNNGNGNGNGNGGNGNGNGNGNATGGTCRRC